MDNKNKKFLQRLLATFKVEAREHINALSSGLIELEKAPEGEQPKIIETVFREAHSLKGAARAVNITDIETLCQSMESAFSALKKQEIQPSASLLDLLHEATGILDKLLQHAGSEPGSAEQIPLGDITARLGDAAFGRFAPAGDEKAGAKTETGEQPAMESKPEPPLAEAQPAAASVPAPVITTETVRVSTEKLNSILLQTEELFSAKLASQQRINELEEIGKMINDWQRRQRNACSRLLKPNAATEKKTEEVADFMDWNQTQVKQMEGRLAAAIKAAKRDDHTVGLMIDSLLDNTKRVMMVSFSSLLEAFPRMVRDISRDKGKNVDLIIEGGEVEIDRRILEEMKDPLMHMVRNCIEHGIETPEERRQNNKSAAGTIKLEIAQRGNHIEILVSDNGSGMDTAGIKAAAARHGVIPRDEADSMPDSEAASLAFSSGVSTSPIITDISGRGLGLAIVREKAEKVGGEVSFETRPGEGTTFRLILPMTTATMRSVIIRAAGQVFALPTASVERVIRFKQDDIKTVENLQTIAYEGRAVLLVRFEDALGVEWQNLGSDVEGCFTAILLHIDNKRVAFLLDEIISEQEIMIKSLGSQFSNIPNAAGATILGTGKVVPVFNVRDLVESAVLANAAARPVVIAPETAKKEKTAVLIAEDSITARTLLKNILEAAGYDATTAVDGIDAFTQLRSRSFDIVISDVDMPRMNGFNLTAKIRSDKKLSELPVVLLTSLESREHRERGVEVGANAYIIKSSFDQSNLLEVIQRLA